MTVSTRQPAVIYCRVSDKGQTGLGSQEHRCRQYAEAKDYDVTNVFYDKASGGGDFMKREGMVALLKYLDDHPHINFVVIFDDLRRYAREAEFHLTLRRLMEERGATRECLNFNFEDSPEGKFTETINAAVGELERQVNARQSRQKKIARLEAGYAVFNVPPLGYKYVKAKHGNNKILIRDEPVASIVQDVLEGFASNRFSSQAEITRYLNDHPGFPKPKSTGILRQQKVSEILTQPMYAGYVQSKELGVPLTPAKHEALISKTTFEKIQDKLTETARVPVRTDASEDFVLRGAVACSSCGSNLRSCWSKGKNKYYAYYLCHTKGCDLYGKSIPRTKIEGALGELIKEIQPTENMVKLTIAAFKLYWDKKVNAVEEHKNFIKQELSDAEAQIGKLVNRIINATNERAISALENAIEEQERKKLVLAEKLEKSGKPQPSFNENLEHALKFLAKPQKLWDSGIYNLQRQVLKLVFCEPLRYSLMDGYRTPKTSLPFSMLGEISGGFLPEMLDGAPGRNRTDTSKGNGILNPARLPVPPQGPVRSVSERAS